jgi:hypothetical protein
METPQPEPTPAPAGEEPKQVVVSKEDILESENLHLRAIAMSQEIQMIQMSIEKKAAEHKELSRRITEKKVEIEKKYGINLSTHYIREGDGFVIPRPAAGSLQGLIGRRLAGAE